MLRKKAWRFIATWLWQTFLASTQIDEMVPGSIGDLLGHIAASLVLPLLANAIVYYNTELLSRVYEQKRAAGDRAAMELLRGMSPVAWQHINLFGSFEFNPMNSTIDIDALAAYYADPAYWDKITRAEGDPPNS
jgi:hypothetical protein